MRKKSEKPLIDPELRFVEYELGSRRTISVFDIAPFDIRGSIQAASPLHASGDTRGGRGPAVGRSGPAHKYWRAVSNYDQTAEYHSLTLRANA
jgi:hypothetical protein